MTADTSLTDAFHQVFGTPPYTALPTPGSYEDYSDQRPGLSKSACLEQRRPKPFVTDELDYTPTGTWVPTSGGAR